MPKPRVDYEFIRAWVKDLETTKVPQATGYLCVKVGSRWGYCCLGRAEVVAGTKSKTDMIDGSRKIFGDGDGFFSLTTLTARTAQRLGIDDFEADPTLGIPKRLRKKADGVTEAEATQLNDEYNFTFKEIAQCIRYTWPKAFAGKQ